MRWFAAILALPALAAVDGTVVNRTTGKPQPKATVTFTKISQAGMQQAGSAVTDAAGRFQIDASPDGPALLQAEYGGVTYNHMITPGASSSGLNIEVFNPSSADGAKVSQHMVLIEPTESSISVAETVIFNNDGNVTYNRPSAGFFRFFLPDGAQARVRVTAPQSVPIERPARKTSEPNIYAVDYPIRPGETRFDLTYELPQTKTFSGRVLHPEGSTRLVAPAGVRFNGPAIQVLGQEPSTQATIYDVKPGDYEIAIEGSGTLRAGSTPESGEEESAIQESRPRIYRQLPWILGLTLVSLAIGFILLYRSSGTRA